MFATSDRFKEVIRDTSEQYLMGIITTANGTVIEINDSVISSGSVSITKQSLAGQELSFGGAVIGELDISIRTELSRYLLYDAIIDLWCRVVVDGESEYIPMGIWVIAEAERDKKVLKIVAYDTLIHYNKEYDIALGGTPYELMKAFAISCGCELAEDEAYYKQLPNWDQFITIDEHSGCATFRDAAYIVAQMCGCYIQSDRYGRISMRQFSVEPAFSLTKGQRYSSSISDFVCHYTELEVTGQAGTFVSTSNATTKGMRMLIEDNTAWDYGIEEILYQRVHNLRVVLEQISYTPCEVNIPSDPSIDCGDMVTLHTDDGEINSLLTSYTWHYRGVMELISSGINPYLQSADSAGNRQIRNLKRDIDAAKVIYYPFRNDSRVKIGSEMQKVASVVFTTIADTSVVFQGTVQIEATVPDAEEEQIITFPVPTIEQSEEIIIDASSGKKVYNYTIGEQTLEVPVKTHKRGFANLCIRYSYDNIDQGMEYIDTLTDGGRVLSLYYPVNRVGSSTTHTFEVWMSIEGGDATIREGMFVGSVSGQGLAVISQWNGQLEVEDYIPIVYCPQKPIDVKSIVDVGPVATTNTLRETGSFHTHLLPIKRNDTVTIRTFDAYIDENILAVKQQTVVFNIANNKYVELAGGTTHLRKTYAFDGESIEIDEGSAMSVHVVTDDFMTVEDVAVEDVTAEQYQ